MKKVLVVTESRSVWGAERSLLQLAKFAEANGVSLHFLISRDSPLARDLANLGFTYLYHDFARHPALEATGSLSNASFYSVIREVVGILFGAKRIWRKLRGFDSILVFSIWQAPETILASWPARVPVDIDFHETFNNRRAMQLLGLIAKTSRKVILPSAVLAERSGLRSSKSSTIIPRPVDMNVDDLERNIGPRVGPMVVGVFGQIQPHKNVLEIAQAIAAVEGNVRLLVVGGVNSGSRTDYERKVRQLVETMANDSEVIDFVPDVGHLMGECEVVINASEHEAFGRTIVEAVSVGCYPIAVGDWGPRETIQALGVGSVLNSIDELPQLLAQLLVARRDAPLMAGVPATLQSYEAQSVASRYFGLLTSGRKP